MKKIKSFQSFFRSSKLRPNYFSLFILDWGVLVFSSQEQGFLSFHYKGAFVVKNHLITSDFLNFLEGCVKKLTSKCSNYDVYIHVSTCFLLTAFVRLKETSLQQAVKAFHQKKEWLAKELPPEFNSPKFKVDYRFNILSTSGNFVDALFVGIVEKNKTALHSLVEKQKGSLVHLGYLDMDVLDVIKIKNSFSSKTITPVLMASVCGSEVRFFCYALKGRDVMFEEIYVCQSDHSLFRILSLLGKEDLESDFWSSFVERFLVIFEPFFQYITKGRSSIKKLVVYSSELSLQNFFSIFSRYVGFKIEVLDNPNLLISKEFGSKTSKKLPYLLLHDEMIDKCMPYRKQLRKVFNFSFLPAEKIHTSFFYYKIMLVLAALLFVASVEFLWSLSMFVGKKYVWDGHRNSGIFVEFDAIQNKIQTISDNNQALEKLVNKSKNTSLNLNQNTAIFLKKLPNYIPNNIDINAVEIHLNSIVMQGYSKNRKNIYVFKDALEQYKEGAELVLLPIDFKNNLHYFEITLNLKALEK